VTRYAKNTTVGVDRSRMELERVLHRYGASEFGYRRTDDRAVVAFRVRGRDVRIELALPGPKDLPTSGRGRKRTPIATARDLEKAHRQRWRALLLVVKAKLEAVESGISTFEQEWLAYIVVDGRTVGERLIPTEAGAPLLLAMKEDA
jgi:hypothetical protein